MAETSGGEVLARILQAEGVEKVSGIIDGTYFGFYSALHRLGIEIVTPRHETSAAHMARRLRAPDREARGLHGEQRPGRGQSPAGPRGRAGRGQPCARRDELPAAADRLPRPGRDLPGLRPGGHDQAHQQVERGCGLVRSSRGTRPRGAAAMLRGPTRRGAPRRARDDHERQVQAERCTPGSRTSIAARRRSRHVRTRCRRRPRCSRLRPRR